MSEEQAPADIPVTKAREESKAASGIPERIVIYPFPKIVLLWPVMVVSLVFFFLGGGVTENPLIEPSKLGWWWSVIFFFNLLVHTFDFGRNNFIATVTTLGVIFLGLWVWDLQTDAAIYGSIYGFFADNSVIADGNFYALMAGMLAILMIMAFITTRFNYWILTPNQLTHRLGILSDERHYSTLNMAVEKEIPDIFEFMLFGSGRLVFKPGVGADSHRTLVVDNVFRVNKLEANVRKFLGTIRVNKGT
jgi:hypothetical protein